MNVDWKRLAPVFLVGLALGASLGSWAQRAAFRHYREGSRSERMLKRLSRDLKLDDAQKEAVKAALEAKRREIDALHEQTFSKFAALRLSANAEVRKVLTPEQQKSFDELSARWEARRQRHRGGKE